MVCNNENSNEFLIKKIINDIEKLSNDTTARLLKQDGKIAEVCVYIKNNLSATLFEMVEAMKLGGQLDDLIKNAVTSSIGILENKTFHIVNVKEFGAIGNGINNDTQAIQNAIDYANTKGRKVYIPKGVYMIKSSIILNGCSIEGEPGNVFTGAGSVIKCKTKDFTVVDNKIVVTN